MRLKIEQLPQHLVPQSFSSPIPIYLATSPSFLRPNTKRDQALLCKFVLSGTGTSTRLSTPPSFNKLVSRGQSLKRACSANFDEFCDEDLLEQMFDLLDDKENEEHSKKMTTCTISGASSSTYEESKYSRNMSKLEFLEPLMLGIHPEPPEWPEREVIIRASIEQKANSMELPLSLRMIKKKQKWPEGSTDLGESSCSSVKKAFSSMVFIILELQSYALQMREVVCYEDLEGVVGKVQREMHASFAWLFQQVLARTPILMVYVMTLLANFSVHSVANSITIQDHSSPGIFSETRETVAMTERQDQPQSQVEMKLFSVSSDNGGGMKLHPVPGAAGGGDSYMGRSSLPIEFPDCVPDDISEISSYEDHKMNEEEAGLWNSVLDEAKRTQAELRDDVLDHEMIKSFTSPVTVDIEPDNYIEYYRTDLLYQTSLSEEPNNPLLLCNYAQFLGLVAHDYDRAEECFKRALQVEPADAEALSLYANFLWLVRKDLWGAEEKYLQAMAAEPDNSNHASKYASFLWSTGGEETCFPIETS
ncbi:uncharacterized protein LOC132312154 [Cornus florida]|uniref:uncharacterized protein LOC132312154 n=1 Tax=Cornus florida TaxID=4283 RepID=UPI00289F9E03|nr:uncharacterized protein LOC132312154 [Cornus florida]